MWVKETFGNTCDARFHSSIQRHIKSSLEREGRLVIFFDGMDEMSRERYSEHTEALSDVCGVDRFKNIILLPYHRL